MKIGLFLLASSAQATLYLETNILERPAPPAPFIKLSSQPFPSDSDAKSYASIKGKFEASLTEWQAQNIKPNIKFTVENLDSADKSEALKILPLLKKSILEATLPDYMAKDPHFFDIFQDKDVGGRLSEEPMYCMQDSQGVRCVPASKKALLLEPKLHVSPGEGRLEVSADLLRRNSDLIKFKSRATPKTPEEFLKMLPLILEQARKKRELDIDMKLDFLSEEFFPHKETRKQFRRDLIELITSYNKTPDHPPLTLTSIPQPFSGNQPSKLPKGHLVKEADNFNLSLPNHIVTPTHSITINNIFNKEQQDVAAPKTNSMGGAALGSLVGSILGACYGGPIGGMVGKYFGGILGNKVGHVAFEMGAGAFGAVSGGFVGNVFGLDPTFLVTAGLAGVTGILFKDTIINWASDTFSSFLPPSLSKLTFSSPDLEGIDSKGFLPKTIENIPQAFETFSSSSPSLSKVLSSSALPSLPEENSWLLDPLRKVAGSASNLKDFMLENGTFSFKRGISRLDFNLDN